MMTPDVARRAEQLAAQGTAFVTATVVRAQRPTSAQAGSVALVLGDGTIEGFAGGVCTEHSVSVYALRVLESGQAMLLRVLPDAGEGQAQALHSAGEEGAVTVRNPCLSGGALEIFLEPVLPRPRVLVVGETPIADALHTLGAELGLDMVAVAGDAPDPTSRDLALVVAAHGQGELMALRRGLEAGVPYVGLVASRRRGAAVIAELRGDGLTERLLERIDVPAGIAIGARAPAEIALSILAAIVAVRRAERAAASPASAPDPAAASAAASAPAIAVDPICGMTVVAMADTPRIEHAGETVYFCCDGCKAKFEAQREHALAPE